MKIFLDGIEFNSKKELKKDIIAMIGNSEKSYRVLENKSFFTSLIENHPEYDKEVNNRVIDHFYIKPNRFNKKTLFVKFTNGDCIDFSWVKCITGKGYDFETKLTMAMRQAIESQIKIFKNMRSDKLNICHICGYEVFNNQESHVDHVVLFNDLKKHFLKSITLKIPDDFNNNIGISFMEKDNKFKNEWKCFHGENAILAITHSTCNLRITK